MIHNEYNSLREVTIPSRYADLKSAHDPIPIQVGPVCLVRVPSNLANNTSKPSNKPFSMLIRCLTVSPRTETD